MDGERWAASWPVTIFIAGDAADARRICREWCLEVGACVTVTPTEYVYTGGQESGVLVGFINYPRFVSTEGMILNRARELAHRLRKGMCQHSYTIQTPDRTYWHSEREK